MQLETVQRLSEVCRVQKQARLDELEKRKAAREEQKVAQEICGEGCIYYLS